MFKLDVTAIIRKLKLPNKFGEQYRFDLHKTIDGKLLEKPVFKYETESPEKAEKHLKNAHWIVDKYNVLDILYLRENEKIPEKDVMNPQPKYTRYELNLENFNAYLQHWFYDFRKTNVDLSFKYNGNDYFEIVINDFDTIKMDEDDIEFFEDLKQAEGIDRTNWIMNLVFGSGNVKAYYDTEQEVLVVHVPYERTTIPHIAIG